MFIISQYLLNNLTSNKLETTSIYAIGIGLVVYACIYLYFLFYNEEFVSIFNKFIIYIIGIDLLLSSFYYANNKNSLEHNQIENDDNCSDDTVSDNENIFGEDEDIFEKDEIQENLLDQHHIHTEDLLENDDFNIESDLESDLEIPQNLPEKISLEEEVPSQTNDFVIDNASEPVEEQINEKVNDITDNKSNGDVETLETLETVETVLNKESKKRRGRKPNSTKLNFL